MPYKIKHGCHYPGCKHLTNKEYCKDHQKLMQKAYDNYTRSPDHNKRYGHEWKRIRENYIKVHPLCEMCLREEKYTPVNEVHHILPISKGGTNDRSNLMSVCRSCHNKLHIELGDRK